MSRFFRSQSDSSSSSSQSGDSDPDFETAASVPIQTISQVAHFDELSERVADTAAESALPLISAKQPIVESQDAKQDRTQLLLHALLEERCMREVEEVLIAQGVPRHRHDRDYVKRASQQRYQNLCTTLASHNLVSKGLDHSDFMTTRQYFRDGLDALMQDSLSTHPIQPWIPRPPARRLLTDVPAHPPSTRQVDVFASLSPLSPLSFAPTRYTRDFDQISMLGKGGFGIVFHVQNRIDGIQYAVKKVPVSPARLARIQARGTDEIAELTREVRTLARLEHPNIVRYYAAWVEWTTFSGSSSDRRSADLDDNTQDVFEIASERVRTRDSEDSRRVVTESNSSEFNIVFENSTSLRATTSAQEMLSVSASASHVSVSGMSMTDGAVLSRNEPTLCLHLQMGLYPLTLADFISPPPRSEQTVQPLAHCFHIAPTLSILTAVVAGVGYLHSESILHRDLKPANIFMSARIGPAQHIPSRSSCSVNLFDCRECAKNGTSNPVSLHVRIGDFGLVTELCSSDFDPTGSERASNPIGTEIYRPLIVTSNASPQLDIFALGIIMFELLWRFGTRMERHERIRQLKQGVFPQHFSSTIGDPSGHIEECILQMLSGGLELHELEQKLRELQVTHQ